MVNAFQAETGITIAMTRKSLERPMPRSPLRRRTRRAIWWGGTGDPHLQAAEEGLTVKCNSPMLSEPQPWAIAQHETAKKRTVGIYLGALGFGYNTEILATEEATRAEMLGQLDQARI